MRYTTPTYALRIEAIPMASNFLLRAMGGVIQTI